MFMAHIVPCDPSLNVQDDFIYRLFSSLAAPIFLFLVGYNFNPAKSNPLQHFNKILIVIGLAVIVDLGVWETLPLYSYDILYTIGISLFLLYVMRSISSKFQLVIGGLLLLASFFYSASGMYPKQVHEPDLSDLAGFQWNELFKNLLLNGWFPLIPWFIFPMFGQLFKKINKGLSLRNWLFFTIPAFCFLTYLTSLQSNQMRAFSVELFYPANGIYLLCAWSFLSVVWILTTELSWTKFNFLASLGKSSLFMYVFHLFFIHSSFEWVHASTEKNMVLTVGLYTGFFIGISYLIEKIKLTSFYPKNWMLMGVLFGK